MRRSIFSQNRDRLTPLMEGRRDGRADRLRGRRVDIDREISRAHVEVLLKTLGLNERTTDRTHSSAIFENASLAPSMDLQGGGRGFDVMQQD